MKMLLLSSLLSLLPLSAAVAQPKPTSSQPPASATSGSHYQNPTHFDFDDDEVDGTRANPFGEDVTTTRKSRQSSLVQPRPNFKDEMLKSVEGL